jgi:GTPase
MLNDRAKIYVKAGSGGRGTASFRREKFVPMGGPDGGDGGRGGSVYLRVDPHLATLTPFRFQSHFHARNGEAGRGQKMHGKDGEDLYVAVAPGTVVFDDETGEPIADLIEPEQVFLVAKGGKGGLGNTHFVTSTHQAPRLAELGEPGDERWIRLELKLIADVGLVGFPNAGKSTLLAASSAARPKIADYPFTTLEPNLGVVEIGPRGGETFVMADIPGLIEGAHRGAGLGHEFLRHIERAGILVHLVEPFPTDGSDPVENYRVIRAELEQHDAQLALRPEVAIVSKAELPGSADEHARIEREIGHPFLAISAVTGQGLDQLRREISRALDERHSGAAR